jgi:acyl-CoA reductase-like NAD-dependent aldehyde dehydrogenase
MISSFKYQHDAVKYANTSPYGQAAYVFHANASKAQKVAFKLEAGRVFINPTHSLWDPRVSYGGVKQSGLGREGAVESLNFFSRQTLIAQDISG